MCTASLLTAHLPRLEGRDALSSGLATHYFSSKEGWDGLDRLEGELTKVVAMDTFTNSEVRGVLDKLFEHKRSRLSFNAMLEMINQVFGLGSLADIMEGLEALGWSAGEETDLLRCGETTLYILPFPSAFQYLGFLFTFLVHITKKFHS